MCFTPRLLPGQHGMHHRAKSVGKRETLWPPAGRKRRYLMIAIHARCHHRRRPPRGPDNGTSLRSAARAQCRPAFPGDPQPHQAALRHHFRLLCSRSGNRPVWCRLLHTDPVPGRFHPHRQAGVFVGEFPVLFSRDLYVTRLRGFHPGWSLASAHRQRGPERTLAHRLVRLLHLHFHGEILDRKGVDSRQAGGS